MPFSVRLRSGPKLSKVLQNQFFQRFWSVAKPLNLLPLFSISANLLILLVGRPANSLPVAGQEASMAEKNINIRRRLSPGSLVLAWFTVF
ncbi:MAG TPA: hypothetical protein PKO06_11545, partial [Candidatus Ozemobacteraceae bacterium]|nr:hypothetical protein [Candidatus Ozemobacteraceae bacterium]